MRGQCPDDDDDGCWQEPVHCVFTFYLNISRPRQQHCSMCGPLLRVVTRHSHLHHRLHHRLHHCLHHCLHNHLRDQDLALHNLQRQNICVLDIIFKTNLNFSTHTHYQLMLRVVCAVYLSVSAHSVLLSPLSLVCVLYAHAGR